MKKTVTISKNTPSGLQRKPFFRVLSYFKDLKWRILAIIVLGLIGIYIYSVLPDLQRSAINLIDNAVSVSLSPQVKKIIEIVVLMIGLEIINEVFAVLCIFLILNYEQKTLGRVVGQIKHKLDVVPVSFIEKFSNGDLTRRIAHSASNMMKNFLVTVYQVSRVSFFYITTSVMMFSIQPILALIVISSLPVCIITARVVSRFTQKLFRAYSGQSNIMTTLSDQKINLHSFNKINGLDGASAEYLEGNAKLASTQTGEDTATALNTIYINFINNFYYLLITVVCGIFFLNGSGLGFGALPMFLMYSKRFLDNAVVITDATTLLQLIGSRSDGVLAIADFPDDVTDREHIDISKITGDIEFQNVTYVENGEKILDSVSFTIPRGASVAFVGPTGGGKSRIVELLSKLAVPTRGRITVDGVNLREISSRSYYARMGIAFEKPFIFEGTVAENILYGIGRTLPEHVMNMTKKLGSHNFIETLPQGYETELYEKTTLLTSSQKQAINVARTALQSPDLIVFNEAMSATDIMTEKQISEEIMSLSKKQTTIFVTHRLAAIEKCQIIMYLENGKILEQGTHAQLMKKKKKYYRAFTKT
jgi:ATP-binding cassette subfamily B protein